MSLNKEQIAFRIIKENGLLPYYLFYRRHYTIKVTPSDYLFHCGHINTFGNISRSSKQIIVPSFMQEFIGKPVDVYLMKSNGKISTETIRFKLSGFDAYAGMFIVGDGQRVDFKRVAMVDDNEFTASEFQKELNKWINNPTFVCRHKDRPLKIDEQLND